MSKTKRVHARRRRASAARAHAPRPNDAAGRSDSPARRDGRGSARLLDRILDTPQLALVVPRLPPEVLHRVIQSCGLEDCGELVALTTPGQLARVFDLDLWRAGRPGVDEQFDADRFGVWIEVLVEAGAAIAAGILAGMGADLVAAALAQHVLVFDPAAIALSELMDGEDASAHVAHDGPDCEVGGYKVVARRTDAWDAIVAVLVALDAEHCSYFHRVMRGCRSLSNSAPELDGLDDLLPDDEQVMFDLAFDRERRRDQQGYVTPAQARAFLQMSRQSSLGQDTAPAGNPVARAYFRAIEWTTAEDASRQSARLPAAPGEPPALENSEDAIAAVVDLLLEAGVLPKQPRALPAGPEGHAPRLARIHAHLQFASDRDPAASAMRSQELAYLANTLMAGCSIQARPFTAQEASEAAVAVCNLGLENWPLQWVPATRHGSNVVDGGTVLPEDFLVGHDLVGVFQVGWKVLHDEVIMYAAEQLIQVLIHLRHADREVQQGLDALRIEMARHWQTGSPWRARDAFDVIMILDMPAWATLLGLIDECPVIHGGIGASRGSGTRAVSASAFEFISERSQIASVRAFMRSLPETLRR